MNHLAATNPSHRHSRMHLEATDECFPMDGAIEIDLAA
jgi:hypothetical protein